MEIYNCTRCQQNYILSKSVCPSCGATEFKASQIDDKGTIDSFTTIWVAPEKFMDQVPYHVIVVKLDKELRITGRLSGPADGLAIGAPVEFTEKDDVGYWFRLT
ncbi:MAG: OB-fold domain-containing protein [Pseudomonadota bacterium]